MDAIQFRIARPTNNLQAVVSFYKDALGLEVIGHFENHMGFDGVMFGMPGKTYHLEFTQHKDKSPLPKPSAENLLVFYYATEEAYLTANARIQSHGLKPVEPANPYWIGKSETYEDPDQWRVVLFNGVYIP